MTKLLLLLLLSIGFSSPAYSYDSRDCWDGYVKAFETDQNYENAIKIILL